MIQTLHSAVTRALEDNDVKKRLDHLGFDVEIWSTQKFSDDIASSSAKYANIIRQKGIKLPE